MQRDGDEFARRLREATANTIPGLLDLETRSRLDATLGRWSLPLPQEGRRPVLLHCDIAPGHLLCDPLTGSLTGVINFGDMAVGDPARDFIYILDCSRPQ